MGPIEEHLKPDECLVFIGDPADYASSHRYPALMHRPAVCCKERQKAGAHRIASPFFLYPKETAVLNPRRLPSLVFDSIQGNVGKCRDNFPWKLGTCYYS